MFLRDFANYIASIPSVSTFFYLFPDERDLYLELVDSDFNLVSKIPLPIGLLNSQPDLKIDNWFSECLAKQNIHITFFNHLLGIPPNFLAISGVLVPKTLLFIHDYFLICPTINLFTPSLGYCGRLEGSTDCDGCLEINFGLGKGTFASRLAYFNNLCNYADLIMFPSTFAAQSLMKFLPVIKTKEVLVINPNSVLESHNSHDNQSSSELSKNIYFLGTLTRNKGYDLFLELVRLLNLQDKRFYPKILTSEFVEGTTLVDYDNVSYNFSFNRETDLKSLPRGIFILTSLWPETYQITVDEALLNGHIVISGNIGALRDREHPNLLKLENPTPSEVLSAVCRIFDDWPHPTNLEFKFRYPGDLNKFTLLNGLFDIGDTTPNPTFNDLTYFDSNFLKDTYINNGWI